MLNYTYDIVVKKVMARGVPVIAKENVGVTNGLIILNKTALAIYRGNFY